MSSPARPGDLRLYEVPEELAAIQAELVANGGELTPEIEARLEAVQMTVDQKATGLCYLIRQEELAAKAIADEAKRVSDLKRTRENSAKRLKDYLFRVVDALGGKLKLPDGVPFQPRIVANGGVEVVRFTGTEEELRSLNHGFLRFNVELDPVAVRDAWKQYQADLEEADRLGYVAEARRLDAAYREVARKCEELWGGDVISGSDEDLARMHRDLDERRQAKAALDQALKLLPQWDDRLVVERGRRLAL